MGITYKTFATKCSLFILFNNQTREYLLEDIKEIPFISWIHHRISSTVPKYCIIITLSLTYLRMCDGSNRYDSYKLMQEVQNKQFLEIFLVRTKCQTPFTYCYNIAHFGKLLTLEYNVGSLVSFAKGSAMLINRLRKRITLLATTYVRIGSCF